MAAEGVRHTLACAAALIAGSATVGLVSTRAVDRWREDDPEWRADGLPNWATHDVLVLALAVSLLVLAGAAAGHVRDRRRARSRHRRSTCEDGSPIGASDGHVHRRDDRLGRRPRRRGAR